VKCASRSENPGVWTRALVQMALTMKWAVAQVGACAEETEPRKRPAGRRRPSPRNGARPRTADIQLMRAHF